MSQVEREAVSVIDDVYPYRPRYREPEERCPEPPMEAVGLPAGRSGFERTMVQDVGFGIRRLVDIANKALSPAINDPTPASRRSSTCRSCCAAWPACA
jgi:uncharacterized membrane protein